MSPLFRSAAMILALASPGLALPARAQQLAEPIPQRRDAITQPMKPQPQRDAMVPCPEHGPGFARQPGGSTCVRVSGQVRGEVGLRDRRSRLNDSSGFNSQARVLFDSRTPTEFGTMRAVISVRGQAGSGFLSNLR
ncbi:MAG: porin [Hyphomicrobiales bacterium]|nr:porin [Hyphomicrobiales bacterium]